MHNAHTISKSVFDWFVCSCRSFQWSIDIRRGRQYEKDSSKSIEHCTLYTSSNKSTLITFHYVTCWTFLHRPSLFCIIREQRIAKRWLWEWSVLGEIMLFYHSSLDTDTDCSDVFVCIDVEHTLQQFNNSNVYSGPLPKEKKIKYQMIWSGLNRTNTNQFPIYGFFLARHFFLTSLSKYFIFHPFSLLFFFFFQQIPADNSIPHTANAP